MDIHEEQRKFMRRWGWNIDLMRKKMREAGIPIPSLIHFYGIKI
jgi:hypothetical protein